MVTQNVMRDGALVTFSTHDLPTFADWSASGDLREKQPR
jgi:4-alpha-glucanotransferase